MACLQLSRHVVDTDTKISLSLPMVSIRRRSGKSAPMVDPDLYCEGSVSEPQSSSIQTWESLAQVQVRLSPQALQGLQAIHTSVT
jgi:hypothetical protein